MRMTTPVRFRAASVVPAVDVDVIKKVPELSRVVRTVATHPFEDESYTWLTVAPLAILFMARLFHVP